MQTPKDIIEEDLGKAPEDWRSNPDYKVDLNTAENWMYRFAEQFRPVVAMKEFKSGEDFKEYISWVYNNTEVEDYAVDPFADELELKYKTVIRIETYKDE